jgi:hypothetical protein
MGKEINKLIHRRSNFRMGGWPLTLVGAAGMFFMAYVALHTLITPLRRGSFDPAQSDDIYLLVEKGQPTSYFLTLLVTSVLCLGVGALLLKTVRKINRKLKGTQAEVSRRRRVDELLNEDE